MSDRFDDAIIGAGIVGLAHAYHLARKGRKVIVFEKGSRATGASIRNFGMIWPIGQPAGEMYRMARRSREIWGEVLDQAGIWHEETGSLHLAYHRDEAQVLAEFAKDAAYHGFQCKMMGMNEVDSLTNAIRPKGFQGALYSPTEMCVDPREVISQLPGWLNMTYGVWFVFGCTVTSVNLPTLSTSSGEWKADNVYVCSGDDLQTLYPEVLQNAGLVRCKLQMMRTTPVAPAFKLGPMLAAGLTLCHYRSFEKCPTLPELKSRFDRELPEYGKYGIHVLVSQNGRGELVLGDSHEYDDTIEPFDKAEIDALVLKYLDGFLKLPSPPIQSRWHGIYAKSTDGKSFLYERPEPGVTLVTGLGGAGMTLSFGLAEKVVAESLAS